MGKNSPQNPMHPINPGSDNILIVRTDRLGDVVLTLPMARAIKKALPHPHVSFLASDYTRPIIERCPDVDAIRTVNEQTSFLKLIRQFLQTDIAFFPSPRFRQVLAAFVARVPRRIGTGYRWYSFLFSKKIYEHRKTAEHHEAEYNLRMLAPMGIEAEQNELPTITLQSPERETVDQWLHKSLGSGNARFAVLHVTSGGSTQPWPVHNFVELGRAINDQYGLAIVLTGVDRDARVIESTRDSMGSTQTLVFVGQTLLELAALLERANLVITIGTGPGHLAAALGAPTIGLFPLPPPLSKERWGFRGPKVINVSPNPISGCPTCQHCTCMERIDTQSVMNAVQTMFAHERSSEI